MQMIHFFSPVSIICICSFLFNFVLCFNVINSAGDFRAQKQKRQISSDGSTFQCKNGQIIDGLLVCDGIVNCEDYSDEISEQCSNVNCPSYSFKCAYGACIDSALKCDQKVDCVDGSDELSKMCTGNGHVNVVSDNDGTKFRCSNRKYINSILICDGKKDCTDGSDETYPLCHNMKCPGLSFRCYYGACINGEFKCDGEKQCVDGSDESSRICGYQAQSSTMLPTTTQSTTIQTPSTRTSTQSTITTTTTTSTPAPLPEENMRNSFSSDFCSAPVPTADKIITFSCPGDGPCVTNGSVRQFTIAIAQCAQNYFPAPDTNLHSTCNRGNWTLPITRCFKKCEKPVAENVDLQCFRNGMEISCDDNLLAGTRARPSCKNLYTLDGAPDYREIVCQRNGEWNKKIFSCIPQCGRSFTNAKTLIWNGTQEKYGEAPWHVAIYNQAKELICGGTIITQQMVLSAAHCFFKEPENFKMNASDFEIVVSKFNRNYSSNDNQFQKVYKINEIRFPRKGFTGVNHYYTGDLAILIVKEKITLSPTVLPSCIYWTRVHDPLEGTLGKVSGWGIILNGSEIYSDKLLTTNLPFISRQECLKNVSVNSIPYVTSDKFCAGSVTGSSVDQGDSGGGLLFQDNNNNLLYIRGIVSVRPLQDTLITVFTDIADHIDWIWDVRNELQETPKENETLIENK